MVVQDPEMPPWSRSDGESVTVVGIPCVAITVTWPAGATGDANFLLWALDHDVLPVVRGGYSGAPPHPEGGPFVRDATRRQHMGFYSIADAERIRAWAKR